ncbi:gamma-glutamyl-gamma-aminobutyrate hydrolase family protein [Marinibactrum halimedae]|uniref:gamma-glutamyl-gamma-aminobutyrate hydrolase n=1 Tax=Marinibactrum halimedae TaxID=1444977 RepID=A0AA37WPY0_9GAMM|nr:gamma-glutamyl-gamma-aminobutyrate hydrolase family protein [Marinibactrum halimedae]MCD9460332.1 gamma-glutamyl-gamma-aminobutyrate hydrolase family protein [Marinibactrum halimedae]GLS26767.1 glutamine amidotransferase [Marinibactrum halimedae]
MALIIGVMADCKTIGLHRYHCVGEKYLLVVSRLMGAIPIMIPALAAKADITDLLHMVDGLLIPGSDSNIDPKHYSHGQSGYTSTVSDPHELRDPDRDHTNLWMIEYAHRKGIPILGICRGLQEINVTFGGTLHGKVHEAGDFFDHRGDASESIEAQYGPAHKVHIEPGGWLSQCFLHSDVIVNSVHGQGICTLAPRLKVEASAPDGLIEAISCGIDNPFLLGVQWHPEWKAHLNPFYQNIFSAFQSACEQYHRLK